MLVMLAPSFDGSGDAYAKLAEITGMVAYDLKARVKPGVWGVVRALADQAEARELALRLRAAGLPVFVVPREVAHDPSRRIVTIRGLAIGASELVLHFRERAMPIAFGALTCIVRGEVHLGQVPGRAVNPSSSTMRAVSPSTGEAAVFRETLSVSNFEAFAAADLHFATVLWAARIDARSFDFSLLAGSHESPAVDLDHLVDELGARASVRVDRGVRSSSLVSVLRKAPGSLGAAPASQGPRSREAGFDERFDPYSRVIAEAERLLALSQIAS